MAVKDAVAKILATA